MRDARADEVIERAWDAPAALSRRRGGVDVVEDLEILHCLDERPAAFAPVEANADPELPRVAPQDVRAMSARSHPLVDDRARQLAIGVGGQRRTVRRGSEPAAPERIDRALGGDCAVVVDVLADVRVFDTYPPRAVVGI